MTILPRFLMAAVLIACGAAGALDERITFYDGETRPGLGGMTFDGKQFTAPGGETIPRDDVQVIEFRLDDLAAAGQAMAQGVQALSDLAQAQVERAARMAELSPGCAGVILVDDGEFEYRPDGTNTYRYHFAGLVLKEEMKAWAQITMGFTEGRSRVRMLFARSIAPDGTMHTMRVDALRVGSPTEALSFFNPNRKVMSGVIPGVEVGSIVEYSYEYDNYNPEDPRLFSPGYLFQSTEPVVFSRVKVTVPKNIPFHYTTRRFEDAEQAKPAITETGSTKSYTWQLENVPPIAPEPYMPPQHDVVPYMDASVFETWEDVFDLLGGLQRARIKLTPAIEAAVTEITAGADSVEDKLARIYHWVQENTRYISIKGSLGAGFSGHTAQETFDNRYGDCTDKAILFSTMLKAIDVDSYPVILRTNDAGTATTEIPTLNGNHCINEVTLNGRDFYLDTTAQNYRYPYFRSDDHDVAAINAIRGDVRTIPLPPPSDNQRFSHLDVTLAENGDVTVRTRNEYNGSTEAGIRGFWKRQREDNRKSMMAEYVNSISPGAVLEDFTLSDLNDLSQQLSMTIDYTLSGHAIRAKDLMYLKIPTLERDYPEVALETRRYPIEYRTTEERILEIDLTLPPGFVARWLPPPLDIQNDHIEYHAKYEEADGKVLFRGVFRRLQREVPAEAYPEYRDALRAIAAFSTKEIFLTDEG
ncbi:MAG: DUF3857 domain-containing protein [Nitrospiraceae bacterium]|nr:DUF3857 domain-containing protein [Nitrospiraceae bacterium]